jgi:uncharacterized membrane protein YcgQ (UPF0703/DUF1980 family)
MRCKFPVIHCLSTWKFGNITDIIYFVHKDIRRHICDARKFTHHAIFLQPTLAAVPFAQSNMDAITVEAGSFCSHVPAYTSKTLHPLNYHVA